MGSSSSKTHRYDHFINPNELEDLDLPVRTGVLPYVGSTPKPKKDPKSNAATGASAAGMRAFTAQAVAFYFRAPVKAFFRTRVDYLVYARTISQEAADAAARNSTTGRYVAWGHLWRNSTFGLLSNAVKTHGWKIIPEQVLPPMVANVAVGAILYTSYLQILGRLHEPSGEVRSRVFPPPSFADTFTAGFLAGGIQAVVAAPLDALMVRYERSHALNGNYNGGQNGVLNKTMVTWGREKLQEIGMRGILAGWTLSFAKDSLGSGVFFSTFEWVKSQGYHKFAGWYYDGLSSSLVEILARRDPDGRLEGQKPGQGRTVIVPHFALEPTFLLLAGISATMAQQGVLFPLTVFQQRHFERLEELDAQARKISNIEAAGRRRGKMFRAYLNAYQETLHECTHEANSVGGLRRWIYRGFWWSTIRQVPSTSAGLIIFELVRRKYGFDTGEIKISRGDYDILL